GPDRPGRQRSHRGGHHRGVADRQSAQDTMMQRFGWLLQRSRPHFGIISLAIVIVSGLSLDAYFLTHRPTSALPRARAEFVSPLSLLPDAVVLDERIYQVCACVYFVAGTLWLAQKLVPWSSWLAALSFTLAMCLHFEKTDQLTHVAHLTCMLLLIHA